MQTPKSYDHTHDYIWTSGDISILRARLNRFIWTQRTPNWDPRARSWRVTEASVGPLALGVAQDPTKQAEGQPLSLRHMWINHSHTSSYPRVLP